VPSWRGAHLKQMHTVFGKSTTILSSISALNSFRLLEAIHFTRFSFYKLRSSHFGTLTFNPHFNEENFFYAVVPASG
jgi:hypothetical protein